MEIKTIGIRVTPDSVFFTVISYENEELEFIIIDKVNTPKAMDVPE
tara:strand:+ start:69 stop:206 length:138 start_codon:yes stop_codon:yes gene_type:complete